jgi:ribonuclease Y
MSLELIGIAALLIGGLGGGFTGYFIRKIRAKSLTRSAEAQAQRLLDEAKEKQKETEMAAKEEAFKIKEAAKKEEQERRNQILELERRLTHKEEVLDKRFSEVDEKQKRLGFKAQEIAKIRSEIDEVREKQRKTLEKIARLSTTEAKKVLLEMTEKTMKEDLLKQMREVERIAKEDSEKEARNIIGQAVQRYAADHAAETTVFTIPIESDEMKGRIIGREGRNINAFEKATGVDVIVDDTPGAIVLSSFDPIRRNVARVAINYLIKDGRIHPTRIEEAVLKSKKEILSEIKEAGDAAVYEVGVAGLSPELVKLLGRLKFRTSYGQNVLKHSIEVAFIAATIASELGADVSLCKKAGLLHDVGKAVDHQIQGNHAAIGRDICRKFGVSEDVIHAVEAHHEDVEFKSVEAMIIAAADAISAARPGARRESMESYIKRLEELENIANSFEGVEKSYAIQAGREVRIIVKPEEIDDLAAAKLAQNIAKKIEEDLQYPGEIKVNVIRETRAEEIAK